MARTQEGAPPSRAPKTPAFLDAARTFYAEAFEHRRKRDLAASMVEWADLDPAEQRFAVAHLLYLNLHAQAAQVRALRQLRELLGDLVDVVDGDAGDEEEDDGADGLDDEPSLPPAPVVDGQVAEPSAEEGA